MFKIYLYKAKSMFGFTSFLTEKERILGTKSINISHIIYLEKNDFLNIIIDFPKDFVKIFHY